VKAVVDAYDGHVTFYVVGPEDQVLETWQRAFPGMFIPASQASEDLRAHFRYPSDLFRVQSVMWSDYHMRTPEAFYTREGAWRIPPDAAFISLRGERKRPPHEDRRQDLRPYWLFTRFPDSETEEFAIVQPLSPERRNVLSGYLVGHSDGERYGALTSYAFPPSTTVLGPPQAQARIDQDETISAWMTLRMQSGSRGKLIALPVGDSLLYVEPLFVQADKSEVNNILGAQLASIPELKKVVVVFGDNVVMRDTLEEAIAAIFGNAARPRKNDLEVETAPAAEEATNPAGPTEDGTNRSDER
jgi:uncharacterized membrane protein (UPF0182 family)